MGILSRFEGKMEDGLEGMANKVGGAPISPVQIAKKAEKAMRREKMVGAGKQYAPTLYTVLVNPRDDQRLFGYYPTLAGETETYLSAKAAEEGLLMDGQPLVRFIVDNGLKHGKFDIIAELVSAPIIAQLRDEELQRYGLSSGNGTVNPVSGTYAAARPRTPRRDVDVMPSGQQRNSNPFGNGATSQPMAYGSARPVQQAPAAAPVQQAPYGTEQEHHPLPYVPDEDIDRSIDYGKYTFNSKDFEEYGDQAAPDPAGRQPVGAHIQPEPQSQEPAAQPAQYHAEPHPQVQPVTAPPSVHPTAANTMVFSSGAGEVDPIPNATAVHARLINTTVNRSYDLASTRIVLGRSSGSDIVIDDINASRSHAEIRFEPQGVWSITDLGSTNGTLVNGQAITSCTLSEGDQVSIGTTHFLFTQA